MNLIDSLKDPQLVATFQKFFGIKITSKVNESKEKKLENEEKPKYLVENKFFYFLFWFGASLGSEIFYALYFPFWFWNIDGYVGRRLILIWALIMYIGQALKDVIKWKRPKSPPVVILEPKYSLEYGMPSTHAMVGFLLPFGTLLFTISRYEYSYSMGLIISSIWCLLVCSSRLYLGMHTVLDVLVGLVLSSSLLYSCYPFIDSIDEFVLKNNFAPFITLVILLILTTFYPNSNNWSPARGDTCVMLSFSYGVLTGSWLNYQLGVTTESDLSLPISINLPGKVFLIHTIIRTIIGTSLIEVLRKTLKNYIFNVLSYLYNLDAKEQQTNMIYKIEIPAKVISYIIVGFNVTFLTPTIFKYLSIEETNIL